MHNSNSRNNGEGCSYDDSVVCEDVVPPALGRPRVGCSLFDLTDYHVPTKKESDSKHSNESSKYY